LKRVRILASASQDLVDGCRFYEEQAEGVGAYFLDSLYSDIDFLIINAGIHPIHFGKYHRLLSKRFPFLLFTTALKDRSHLFMRFSIAAENRPGSGRSYTSEARVVNEHQWH